MTVEDFTSLDLPVDASNQLYVESGLEWLQANTTLEFDLADVETIKSLPASARLFLVKYCEICDRASGVASETVGPMSKTFSTDSIEKQTGSLARQLLKQWLKPNVTFIPCRRRWKQ